LFLLFLFAILLSSGFFSSTTCFSLPFFYALLLTTFFDTASVFIQISHVKKDFDFRVMLSEFILADAHKNKYTPNYKEHKL